MKTCEARIKAAVLKERRACAKIAGKDRDLWNAIAEVQSDHVVASKHYRAAYSAGVIATAIKARTKKPAKGKK